MSMLFSERARWPPTWSGWRVGSRGHHVYDLFWSFVRPGRISVVDNN